VSTDRSTAADECSGELDQISQFFIRAFVSPAEDPLTEEPAVGVTSEPSAPHAFDHVDN